MKYLVTFQITPTQWKVLDVEKWDAQSTYTFTFESYTTIEAPSFAQAISKARQYLRTVHAEMYKTAELQ